LRLDYSFKKEGGIFWGKGLLLYSGETKGLKEEAILFHNNFWFYTGPYYFRGLWGLTPKKPHLGKLNFPIPLAHIFLPLLWEKRNGGGLPKGSLISNLFCPRITKLKVP